MPGYQGHDSGDAAVPARMLQTARGQKPPGQLPGVVHGNPVLPPPTQTRSTQSRFVMQDTLELNTDRA
jgi:hypothetical protein